MSATFGGGTLHNKIRQNNCTRSLRSHALHPVALLRHLSPTHASYPMVHTLYPMPDTACSIPCWILLASCLRPYASRLTPMLHAPCPASYSIHLQQTLYFIHTPMPDTLYPMHHASCLSCRITHNDHQTTFDFLPQDSCLCTSVLPMTIPHQNTYRNDCSQVVLDECETAAPCLVPHTLPHRCLICICITTRASYPRASCPIPPYSLCPSVCLSY